MKTFFAWMLFPALAVLSGCTTGQNGAVLDPVGPAPGQFWVDYDTNGTLVVYSAYEVNADFAGRDRRSPVYSDYKIFNPNGGLRQKVHNNSGTLLQAPVPVPLPPGAYQVRAHVNGYASYVSVPVVIATGQTTVLHLEGDGFWPDQGAFNQTNAVQLPNGMVIGWKAAVR